MEKNKFIDLINEELDNLLNELLDPNNGEMFLPDNIDPSVMKLFEKYKKQNNIN